MKISIVFSLIYVIVSSWCQNETVFHCSPKPGCQIAQCDPVAVGWDRPGFNIDEHLHDKEFPITCKSKNAEQPQNAFSLFPFVSRNTMDIGSIKSELKELEGNSNKNAENIDALKRNYSDISNIKSEFKELEENVDEKMKSIHSFEKEISIIREIQNENAEQFAEIADLKQSREEQSAEIRELKKDLVRLETMNSELLKELNEQKQTNNEMKKSMERIEEKLSATEKPRQVQSGNQQRPTTTTKTTLKPTPSPEIREIQNENTEQSAEITDLKQSRAELKKDLVRLETINDKLLTELYEQKQGNNEMKEAIGRLKEKLSAMEKTQQVQSGNQQIPTTTTKTTLKPTPSPEIREIQNENTEQSAEITDLKQSRAELKKDLVRLETINDKLLTELYEQKQGNNEMKEAIGRLKEKLSAMEKTQQVQSGNQQIPTTTTKTTLKPTPSPENCKLKIENMCYFAVIHDPWDVDYDTAIDICKKRNADVGFIRDEESYNAIMNYLVKNTPMGFRGIIIWTRIRFDPMTRDVTPADSFIKWSSPFDSFPRIGIKNKDRTNVYLHVDSKLIWHSMGNASPTLKLNGVICEIQI
uniref:golgin subfamily A member 3-like n=1 Tax=Styela clava TaxID=7725 RepID=UPI00193977AD|nr:golgin subfamily A member 3-like [Styela clava]